MPPVKRRPYKPKSVTEIARNMSAIRSRENRTEVALRRALFASGLRYRKYGSGLYGHPDIVFPRARVVVFVDGDYWHGRTLREKGEEAVSSYYTEAQRTYWVPKLRRTVQRDAETTAALRSEGWLVLRFWESDVKANLQKTCDQIVKTVQRRSRAFTPNSLSYSDNGGGDE